MIDIPAARAICEAATKGPWLHIQAGDVQLDELFLHFGEKDEDRYYNVKAFTAEDMTFARQARTLLPAALDEIEALRAEREELLRLLRWMRVTFYWQENDGYRAAGDCPEKRRIEELLRWKTS